MNISTKYQIGDLVKVITPTNQEFLAKIDEIEITVTEKRIVTRYFSDNFKTTETSFVTGEPETYKVPLLECKHDSYNYIKCKVMVTEIE